MIFIENLISLQRFDENLTLLLRAVISQITECTTILLPSTNGTILWKWPYYGLGILVLEFMEFPPN